MLMRKVTRIAGIEGEKDQAVQLSSQVPLSAMLAVCVACRKSCWWFDFTESLNDSVVHLSAGRHLPGDQGFKLQAMTPLLFEQHQEQNRSHSKPSISMLSVLYNS
jgi:hypothetical protein